MQRCGLLFFLSSGIGQQRWHLPAVVMGNPRLLQEWPNIAALLSQRGGDGKQAAAADGALAGLDAMADLALNHRLAQGTLGGVVRGFDALDFQESPETIGHGQQLIAGADRFGPRHSLTARVAQLHHPPQRGLKGLADWYAGLLQVGPIDCSLLVAVPVGKQLPLQIQHRHWRPGVRRWR